MFISEQGKVRSNTQNESDSERAADVADIGAPAACSPAAVLRSVRLTWSALKNASCVHHMLFFCTYVWLLCVNLVSYQRFSTTGWSSPPHSASSSAASFISSAPTPTFRFFFSHSEKRIIKQISYTTRIRPKFLTKPWGFSILCVLPPRLPWSGLWFWQVFVTDVNPCGHNTEQNLHRLVLILMSSCSLFFHSHYVHEASSSFWHCMLMMIQLLLQHFFFFKSRFTPKTPSQKTKQTNKNTSSSSAPVLTFTFFSRRLVEREAKRDDGSGLQDDECDVL